MQVIIRGDYDLKSHAHAKGSKSFEYLNKDTNDRFIPQVIECSVSIERLVFALISSAYKEDEVHEKLRSYLGFNPTIAPVKVTVLPLDKTNKSLVEIARKLSNKLRRRWNITVDVSGSIGKRYRRADEIGVPFCVTVDSEATVTVRERDSMEQTKISIDEVIPHLSKLIDDEYAY
jgi:glycyl-tRNA synthetase